MDVLAPGTSSLLEVVRSSSRAERPGPLTGIRVIEIADEQAEYCGLTLAGLGADVVKVEPPGGSPTRRIGPFYKDKADPEGSLFFWQYNRGKRSIVLDLKQEPDRARFRALLADADILLESTPKGELDGLGLGPSALAKSVSGADPRPRHAVRRRRAVGRLQRLGSRPSRARRRDDELRLRSRHPAASTTCRRSRRRCGTPITSPASSSSMAIMAALMYRFRTGKGQQVSCAVHEAVAKCTEVDLMTWVMRRAPVYRQTCRHARESVSPHPTIAHTKDGRWVMANLGNRADDGEKLVALLERYGIEPGSIRRRPRRRAPGASFRAPRPTRRSAIRPWRPCRASCAPSPTRTCPGARRRRPACCGRRCASRTRTPSISTGWSAAA